MMFTLSRYMALNKTLFSRTLYLLKDSMLTINENPPTLSLYNPPFSCIFPIWLVNISFRTVKPRLSEYLFLASASPQPRLSS